MYREVCFYIKSNKLVIFLQENNVEAGSVHCFHTRATLINDDCGVSLSPPSNVYLQDTYDNTTNMHLYCLLQ